MQSLLEKVKSVEKEAQDRINQIERAGQEKLSDIENAESDLMNSVRNKAEKRGEEIVREALEKAKREVNAIHQDREQTIKTVKENSLKNRDEAVKTILRFFYEDFIGKEELK